MNQQLYLKLKIIDELIQKITIFYKIKKEYFEK